MKLNQIGRFSLFKIRSIKAYFTYDKGRPFKVWASPVAVSKETACNEGDLGSSPRLGRSPGKGNSSPFQYSGPENSMDREAWRSPAHGVTKSQT